ncbi:S8 family serine peptidase [Novipirellula sp. SH528]|uniref:S8 family serine peptidase n=1 Tax=Novipirellula sp. SH528 TaxID=3454466 RepID=UPI003FA10B9F
MLLAAEMLNWFASFDDVPRIEVNKLSQVDVTEYPNLVGPRELARGEWIIQLQENATEQIQTLDKADQLLDAVGVDATIATGLGAPGLLIARVQGDSKASIEASLTDNPNVKTFSLNTVVSGQATTPNDSDFVGELLNGLNAIRSSEAWDLSRGSSTTVVGVIDSGIDPTHEDLYLNIWLNQGELPPQYLDDLGDRLVDIDGDGLITFYDLNNFTRSDTGRYELVGGNYAIGPNAGFVRDLNGNNRIDADDLIRDPNWADGRDTDGNGFADDFFGVNFRTDQTNDFAKNNPADSLGHGTHVAGVIGAIGSNDIGGVGVNWQTSLMSLRILNNSNQGDSGSAIRAINYASMMRERYQTDAEGRVVQGANVRVLNNSWGQPGGYEASVETAISDSGDAGILFVAATGNGNVFGEGVNNDLTAFYPASYASSNVIAVGAAGFGKQIAPFSNYGVTSADLLAPGIGIRSTFPNNSYATLNGTSFSTPFVSGTAALLASLIPNPTAKELRSAILDHVEKVDGLENYVAKGGVLSAIGALKADVFMPSARFETQTGNISESGGTRYEFDVVYQRGSGNNVPIDTTTLGNDDIEIKRSWGSSEVIETRFLRFVADPRRAGDIKATYEFTPPGGDWDPLDFGDYVFSVVSEKIKTTNGKSVRSEEIGSINAKVDAPDVIYVTSFADTIGVGSLRDAIEQANARGDQPTTIILASGTYALSLQSDLTKPIEFTDPGLFSGGTSLSSDHVWTDNSSGDLDILGKITLVGDSANTVVIDANGIDRAIKVHENASLTLQRLTVTGGVAPNDESGGGILSAGNLTLDQVIVRGNEAIGVNANVGGGGVAIWGGTATIRDSRLTDNRSDAGGGVYFANFSTGEISGSTLDSNTATDFGGAVAAIASGQIDILNSTLSLNQAADGGAVVNRPSGTIDRTMQFVSPAISGDGSVIAMPTISINKPGNRVVLFDSDPAAPSAIDLYGPIRNSQKTSVSQNGRFIAFDTDAQLDSRDKNKNTRDIYVYDRDLGITELVSVTAAGVTGNFNSSSPSISADGRYVVFQSDANNLIAADKNARPDIFLFDRATKQLQLVSATDDGDPGNGRSLSPVISADGNTVAYLSTSRNFAFAGGDGADQVFVFDRNTGKTIRATTGVNGDIANNASFSLSISADGKKIAFNSYATNLTDTGSELTRVPNVFLFDKDLEALTRVNLKSNSDFDAGSSSFHSAISSDGRYIVFDTRDGGIVAGDLNDRSDIFLRDLSNNQTVRINTFTTAESTKYHAESPVISDNGDVVVYTLRPISSSDPWKIVRLKRVSQDSYDYQREELPVESGALVSMSHTTMVGNTGAAILLGEVEVQNSILFALGPESFESLASGAKSLGDNLFKTKPTSSNGSDNEAANVADFISPLTQLSGITPVHLLKIGSTAINNASGDQVTDQLGRQRVNPDIGAVEASGYTITGTVFLDTNANGYRDANEFGQSDVMVYIDQNNDGKWDLQEPFQQTLKDDPTTLEREDGNYTFFSDKLANSVSIRVKLTSGFSQTEIPLQKIQQKGITPSLSADGRFIAFSSRQDLSAANTPDTQFAIYVEDRLNNTIDRITASAAQDNGSFYPVIGGDGRFVAFESQSKNLVKNPDGSNADTNSNGSDVFLHDRVTGKTSIVSVTSDETQKTGDSYRPSLTTDGRFVVFHSTARLTGDEGENTVMNVYLRDMHDGGNTTLVSKPDPLISGNNFNENASISANGKFIVFTSSDRADITNPESTISENVYLFDVQSGELRLLSRSKQGGPATGRSRTASISETGDFVVFESSASDLDVPDQITSRESIRFDVQNNELELVSRDIEGKPVGAFSDQPVVSSDGRFIVFSSYSANLSPEDTSTNYDVYIYDRKSGKNQLLSNNPNLPRSDNASGSPSISANGAFIAFDSDSSTLVRGDVNDTRDAFVVPNPFLMSENSPPQFAHQFRLSEGDFITKADFGILPKPGNIRGRVYEDFIANNTYDDGEAVAGVTVFLDLNDNGRFDNKEPLTTTATDGTYSFISAESNRVYSIGIVTPTGLGQVVPSADDDFVWTVYLPAGENINLRNFQLIRSQSTGQSAIQSEINGRLYDDTNGNGAYDEGEPVYPDITVYLDQSNRGVRDPDELQVKTDGSGRYVFENVGSGIVSVSVELGTNQEQATPLGNTFESTRSLVYSDLQPTGNAQTVVPGDFNQDGYLDVVIAHFDSNNLSIRLNDQNGGFSEKKEDQIDIPLKSLGNGPTSLIVGNFDDNPRLDIATTAYNSNGVLILLNFNPLTKSFGSSSAITVGNEPIDIVAGHFNSTTDSYLDLAVVNQDAGLNPTDASINVLINDGKGQFTTGPKVLLGGRQSYSIVSGDFNGDDFIDLAVTQEGATGAISRGRLVVLAGDGTGSFALDSMTFPVGSHPRESVAADLNGDNRIDIAIANAGSNSISILVADETGKLKAQSEIAGIATGISDLSVADMDNDNDLDIVVSSLQDGEISIFRNISNRTIGDVVRFEPLDNLGTAPLKAAKRMPITLGKFDETPAEQPNGTFDIVTIPKITDGNTKETIFLFKNELSNGSRRVSVTGGSDSNAVNQDFIIRPSTPETISPTKDNEEISLLGREQRSLVDLKIINTVGFGKNTIRFDAASIGGKSITIKADVDDVILHDGDWTFIRVEALEDKEQNQNVGRIFTKDDATIRVLDPWIRTNPVDRYDVNADGVTTALDALIVLNELQASIPLANIKTALRSSRLDIKSFRLDIDWNGVVTAADALGIINQLNFQVGKRSNVPQGEAIPQLPITNRKEIESDFTREAMSTQLEQNSRRLKTASEVGNQADPIQVTVERELKMPERMPFQSIDSSLESTMDWISL